MEKTIYNVRKTLCTGCCACLNVCPKKAIKMQPDSEGFLRPLIEKEKCINCGMCFQICPAENNDAYENFRTPELYALAADDEIRMKSSSGGVFTVFAEEMLKSGGYVAGAAWTKECKVEHRLISKIDEISALRGSKYVQSNIGNVFFEIRTKLEENQRVLFTGTPCQVAGLKHYLKRDYPKLITIDIVCHGCPSPKAFHSYLMSELKSDRLNDIAEINFRDKKKHGWGHSINIKLKNGIEYDHSRNESSWYESFINGLNIRPSCGSCRYAKLPRQGDITMGDFWGFGKYFPDTDIDASKGISLLAVNSQKGKEAFENIKSHFTFIRTITLDMAKTDNGNLTGSPKTDDKSRECFFSLLNDNVSYDKAVRYSTEKEKYDIGLVGWWYGKNYGSIITNFALNRYLKSKKLSVLMLEWPLRSKPKGCPENSMARRLAEEYYDTSLRRTFDEMPDVNKVCNSFILGSDQLWNYDSAKETDFYFFLDFAERSKKTIAYSTSFGHDAFGDSDSFLKKASFFMNRIDHISVREFEGVRICKNTFGVDAVQTMDPVFICDKIEYYRLIEKSKYRKDQKYICAYILDPSLEKKQVLKEISEKTKMPISVILDAQGDVNESKELMDMDDCIVVPEEIGDWLALLYHSEYVVTDSYHGFCFSIIFEKQFVCIENFYRGAPRFRTVSELLGLNENLTSDLEKASEILINNRVNYSKVRRKLNSNVSKSKKWLNNVLQANKLCRTSAYDILIERIRELENEVEKLKKQVDENNGKQ